MERSRAVWPPFLLLAFVAAGCVSAPASLAPAPPGTIAAAHEGPILASLAAGDPWAVVAFRVRASDWEERGGRSWLEVSSSSPSGEVAAEAANHRVFLVRDGLLENIGGAWGPLNGWRMGFTGEPADSVVVVLLAAAALERDTVVELRVGSTEGGASAAGVDAARSPFVLAFGQGAQLARYEDGTARERPLAFHLNATDDRARASPAGRTLVGPGRASIAALQGGARVGLHLGEVHASGSRMEAWHVLSRIGTDAQEASGVSAPARSLNAFVMGSGGEGELRVALDASAAEAEFETSVSALFVPWDPASAGFRVERVFSVPAAMPPT